MNTSYFPVVGSEPWTAECTFTADSEDADYPASNLGTADLNEVFRSTAKSVVISWTMSRPRPIGLVQMFAHNFSQGATFRQELFSDAAWTTLIYDTDAEALTGGNYIFPPTYSDDQLILEDDNFFTARYRSEELALRRLHRFIWLESAYPFCQSGRLTISNEFNPNYEYLEIGHLAPARGRQLSRGIQLGPSQRGVDDLSVVTQADGGKKYGEEKIKTRRFQGSFAAMNRQDAEEVLEELKIARGTVPQNLFGWHPFPRDTRSWLRRSFPARFVSLGFSQYALPLHDTVPVDLEEVI